MDAVYASVCTMCVRVLAYRCARSPRCSTRQMLITGDSDRDRDSDSCPVLFDTFVDYRSKASYVGSKNYRAREGGEGERERERD